MLKLIQNNRLSIKKIIVIYLLLSIGLGQQNISKLEIVSNPKNNNYWWLEKNNYGKSIESLEIDYEWILKTENTTYKINISNAYKDSEYVFSSTYNILEKRITQKNLYFGESFIKHNFSNKTFLKIGKYYRDFSQYLNDDLSSGSTLISKNAQPMPKIGIVTSYTLKNNNNISFDFGLAHGLFDHNNYYTKKAPFLHEKFFYMHTKKNQHQFSIGFVHEAVWGGETEEYGEFPDSFEDFLKVIISADGEYEGGPHANALGNHLGIWDFYYQKTNNAKILKLYYQHFFEDTSSLRFANSIDGLWGLELKNYIPETTILLEYLDTSHAYDNPPYQADYYYWNYQYRIGWRYRNNSIGNSFINPNNQLESIKLLHLGISGTINDSTYYKVLISKTQSRSLLELKLNATNYEVISVNKKIDIPTPTQLKILLSRKISAKINLNAFMVGNGSNYAFGFGASYLIKK